MHTNFGRKADNSEDLGVDG